jgi:thiol-disulfide isomerase/thioredoxin/uncharacterized membrane protein YphA (DoxX/SURF4 family)
MATVALGARVLLALVFLLAAVGKLADMDGTREALDEFHVPRRLIKPAAWLLPAAELLSAGLLMIAPTARVGAILAILLLGAFVAGIAAAMARGEAPDCHCFGQISSSPAGRGTLIRNAVLAAVALFVAIYGPGDSINAWVSGGQGAAIVAVVAVAAAVGLAGWSVQLWRERGSLADEVQKLRTELAAFPPGLPVGANAPRFGLPSADGQVITLDSLLARGHPVALMFVSPDCGPCAAMFPDIARWQMRLDDKITIAIPTNGPIDAIRSMATRHGLENVMIDDDYQVFSAYRGAATPSVMILSPEGQVSSRMHSTHAIIEGVIRKSLQSEAAQPSAPTASNGKPFEIVQSPADR